ncbi:MAG: DNA mismatch repair endonuclease MutL [Haemophilus parainfluenzae]|nr:DNA mismatch repair endonuclease MutL [Haemophilus parainfluenzae]
MAIKILSPQLANQIAAGEVVERPSSVVKELVENSLDAGANKIHIDIENGGANLIRIRDNGSGIPKEELSLALARHATSKIADLDDLEAILSLGFRGEALASISSVSRLTLTSRTTEQNEAWQVYAQGREMETTIKPASHPVGTTVEVANLFFNTPARRKFLRTDKTEFAHIDEVIRRIALAKFNIAFTLTHNGKIIRQYRPATNEEQQLKRVAAICGDDFVQHALRIDWKHDDLHLSGWVATPEFTRSQNDLSYCYINGRMVRDKVITHAIRQAYAEHLHTEQYPAFVLFIDLNPHDVDVNVHPTKHDFICQGVTNALNAIPQAELDLAPAINEAREPSAPYQTHYEPRPNRAAAGQNIFASNYHQPREKQSENRPHFSNHSEYIPTYSYREQPTKTEQRVYSELVRPTEASQVLTTPVVEQLPQTSEIGYLRALALIENKALLLQQNQQFYLMSLAKLQTLNYELTLQQSEISQQPLLIPIIFRLDEKQFEQWQKQKAFFQQSGFEFIENEAQLRLTLNKVPAILRTQNLQKCVVSLTALCHTLEMKPIQVLADVVSLLSETERLLNKTHQEKFNTLLKPINWQPFLSDL